MAEIININQAEKPQGASLVSATGTTKPRCDAATRQQGKAELGGCLTLVSPSGLTADDRTEWLAVAMQTLSGIPADLLAEGCAEARKRCRFPSEIVPTIIEAVETRWAWRKEAALRPAPMPVSHQIEAPPVDDKPFTLPELLAMPSNLIEMARGQDWATPETFAEYDRARNQGAA